MAQKDLHNNIKVSRAISPTRATDNTALVSQIIDTQGYESLEFAIAVGTIADADATFATTMDEGDASNLAGSNAVAAADLLGSYAGSSFVFSNDDTVYKLGYRGTKRYVRLTITPSLNTGNADISALAIQSHARHAPVA
ncbi:MAG TPA: hypothetical protein VK636_23625 [Gemmatimonadaceae bacterium]|nr:hypothetical protein [Gemmatimonadaceae bacterium]